MSQTEIDALNSMMRWIVFGPIVVVVGSILLGHVVVYFIELYDPPRPKGGK